MAANIVIGMSGGVDSSVAAFILKQQGFNVEGISFTLYEAGMLKAFPKAPCCSIEAMNDAARTAEFLGIRHTIIDLRVVFIEKVIEPFIASYSNGITPNPCILCNKHIKFPYLLKAADEKKADFIATGHYANIKKIEDVPLLMRAADPKKDQSYVLYSLDYKTLNRLILPLGKNTKDKTREMANNLHLPAANRKESQEICFIGEMGYFSFIEGLIEPKAGHIIDAESGNILGDHKGIHLFTIGQRKRTGIATGKPCYVTRIDISENAVYLGAKEMAMQRNVVVRDINWLVPQENVFNATVKIRSMMKDEPAIIEILDTNTVKITFEKAQWAPAPGQSAVFYMGDVVIGGGIII